MTSHNWKAILPPPLPPPPTLSISFLFRIEKNSWQQCDHLSVAAAKKLFGVYFHREHRFYAGHSRRIQWGKNV